MADQFDEQIGRHLDAARRGEQVGYTGLYRCLAGRVAGFARARGVDDVDALVNEVFLGAFRSLGGFQGAAPEFRSWVFAIAWNKVADVHRAAARRPPTTDVDALATEPVGGDAEDDALDALAVHDAHRLLERLTADQRDVLLLRIVADLSLEQTAEVAGRPVGAVKALQHRALAAIRRHLDEAISPHDDPAMTEVR